MLAQAGADSKDAAAAGMISRPLIPVLDISPSGSEPQPAQADERADALSKSDSKRSASSARQKLRVSITMQVGDIHGWPCELGQLP